MIRPKGVRLADNWTSLWQGPIQHTLNAAGAMEAPFFWTGSGPDGIGADANCHAWTSNRISVMGYAARRAVAKQRWASPIATSCFNYIPLLCGCLRQEAQALTIYFTTNPALKMGGLGSRANADHICAQSRDYYDFRGCVNPAALLCYSDVDNVATIPMTHGYSPNAQVNIEIYGTSYNGWSAFLDVFTTMGYGPGCLPDGTFSGSNCKGFTTTAGVVSQPNGAKGRCTERDPAILCACPVELIATPEPTQQPTQQPTSAFYASMVPSVSPSETLEYERR